MERNRKIRVGGKSRRKRARNIGRGGEREEIRREKNTKDAWRVEEERKRGKGRGRGSGLETFE